MRRFSVLLAFLIAIPVAAATEPNPSAHQREVIDQILRAMNFDTLSGSIIDAMFAQLQKQFLDDAAAKGDDAEAMEEAKELFTVFRQRAAKINFGQLLHEAQIRIYAKYFTEKELEDIAAFYASSTGKKMLSVMPQLMAEGMKLGNDTLAPKFQELLAQSMDDIEHKHPWRKTMSDIRALGAEIDAYAEQQTDETYPQAADLAGLKLTLKTAKLPEKDMWGHAYEYVVSPDRHHYRIVSAGADGIFEWDSRKIDSGAAAPALRYRDRLEDDIIWADGAFVQLPVQAKPKGK